ncbi:MAG TPA: phosphotransferase [Candidatus Saccharibacteria bacterium]|nr:phosphotransferase [Candidatus Saccharibacteria bacterium]
MPVDKKFHVNQDDARIFLSRYHGVEIEGLEPLHGGEWSTAYGYSTTNQALVARFSQYDDDFRNDAFVNRFSNPLLPIPRLHDYGEYHDLGYYAISQRVEGEVLEDSGNLAKNRLAPVLASVVGQIMCADISQTSGYGLFNEQGNGEHANWTGLLKSVRLDDQDSRIHGWRHKLAGRRDLMNAFDSAYRVLAGLCEQIKPERSLAHNDLINRNVMFNGLQVSGVFDWGFAMYADKPYDLAKLTFFEPIYEPIKGIDWESLVLSKYGEGVKSQRQYSGRLLACLLYVGLETQTFYASEENWDYVNVLSERVGQILYSDRFRSIVSEQA